MRTLEKMYRSLKYFALRLTAERVHGVKGVDVLPTTADERCNCVCGVVRRDLRENIWQVTDKENDFIYPKYMYRCYNCSSFSAVRMHFPVDKYNKMALHDMHISDLKVLLNEARLAWIQERVSLPNNPVLFDLGSGEGCFTHIFAKYYPHGRVYAIEGDARLKEKFYGEYDNVNFVPEYIEPFLARVRECEMDKPDLMILTDVLEHVVEPEKLLESMANAIALGGFVYITVPNANTFMSPYPVAVPATEVDWRHAENTCQHLWMLTPQTLELILEKYFTIVFRSTFETEIRRDSIYSTILCKKK